MQIIDELETVRRGPYAGAIGYLSYGGDLDTCICIRTVVVKDGVAYVQAGAGIVADSVPAMEYDETRNKAAALLRAIDLAHEQFGDGGPVMTPTTPRAGDGTRVFMIDNYDSFTYNLVQLLGELGADITVKRNDQVTRRGDRGRRSPRTWSSRPAPARPTRRASAWRPSPTSAPRGCRCWACASATSPSARCTAAWCAGPARRCTARPTRSTTTAPACSPACPTPSPPRATTRWSWTRRCPTCLALTAWNADGIVMGVRHRELPVHGVQFHPESVLTEVGLDLLATFLRMTARARDASAARRRRGGARCRMTS